MSVIESVMMRREERWIQHYSSAHSILLVGEGDFSFSLCLAMAFGSATNIVATSLDSYDHDRCFGIWRAEVLEGNHNAAVEFGHWEPVVLPDRLQTIDNANMKTLSCMIVRKYKNAKANLRELEILCASLLHGVDATRMKMLTDLQCRKFRRIIYNFPHAGFHSKEDDPALINMHRSLVSGFFRNARRMLMVDGEIHLNHKVTSPYNKWRIEDLASDCALLLVECPVFSIKDYPGYKNKRGAGSRCDMPFRLGECRTFKFKLFPAAEKILKQRRTLDLIHKMPDEFKEVPILQQHQPRPLEILHPLGYDHVPPCVSTECHKVFGPYLKYVEDTFGGTSYALYQSVCEALMTGFRTYICSVPGGTWSGYIGILEELHNLSILRSEILRQMLASTC